MLMASQSTTYSLSLSAVLANGMGIPSGGRSQFRISEDDHTISRGPMKGKKVKYASTVRIEEFAKIASEFMGEIFDFLPGEYLITDESDVLDFTPMESSDTSEIWGRIENIYGISESEFASGRLVNLFAAIARRRNIQ
jgi:hypothetical protein